MPKTPVFVSWSGDRSKAVAVALCDWLRLVLQTTDPWCSPEIPAGDRWSTVVADRLHKSSVGVIVVTIENQAAPWLLFEAGALSKIVDRGKVIPFYVGLKPTDVQGPLSQFQGKIADKDGTLEMLEAVNATIDEPHPDKALADLFDMWWPKLETVLAALPKPEKPGKRRPVEDMVEEVLTIVRRIDRAPGGGAPPTEGALARAAGGGMSHRAERTAYLRRLNMESQRLLASPEILGQIEDMRRAQEFAASLITDSKVLENIAAIREAQAQVDAAVESLSPEIRASLEQFGRAVALADQER